MLQIHPRRHLAKCKQHSFRFEVERADWLLEGWLLQHKLCSKTGAERWVSGVRNVRNTNRNGTFLHVKHRQDICFLDYGKIRMTHNRTLDIVSNIYLLHRNTVPFNCVVWIITSSTFLKLAIPDFKNKTEATI